MFIPLHLLYIVKLLLAHGFRLSHTLCDVIAPERPDLDIVFL